MLLDNLKINKIMNIRKYSNKSLQEGKMAKLLHIYLPPYFPSFKRKFLNACFKYIQRANTYIQQPPPNILSNKMINSININTSNSSELCCQIPFPSRWTSAIFESLMLLMCSLYHFSLWEVWISIILTSENYF